MWKLMVERKYKFGIEDQYGAIDRMYFEAETLEALDAVVNKFMAYATDGSYKYIIEFIDGKNGED